MELTSLESPEVVKGGKVTGRNKFFSYNNKKVIFPPLRIMKVISENTAPNVKQTHEPISLNALPSYFFPYLSFRSQGPK